MRLTGRPRPSRTALLLTPLLPLLPLLAAAPAARADDGAAADGAAPGPPPRIVTVLDVSGSMAADDAGDATGTRTRMDAAKEAMDTLIDSTPARVPLGIRLYGDRYPGENKAKGCRDTRLVSPVAGMDAGAKAAARKTIAGLEPTGFTPIGASLRAAAKDLGTEGERRIVLISDGEDTCAPPQPCEVAKELDGAGVDLTVDTLGFKVDGKAAEQLKCIAEATGGRYRPAEDATELGAAVQDTFRQALKGYRTTGTPVEAGKDCASAPVLQPGQYLDRYAYREEGWYRAAARPGQSVRFSATWVPEDRESGFAASIRAAVYTEAEQGVAFGRAVSGANFGVIRSTGEATRRLDFRRLPSGRSTVPLCLKVDNWAGSDNATEPVELTFALSGRPLTRADAGHEPITDGGVDDPDYVLQGAPAAAAAPAPSPDREAAAQQKAEAADGGRAVGGIGTRTWLWTGAALALGLLIGAGTALGRRIGRNR